MRKLFILLLTTVAALALLAGGCAKPDASTSQPPSGMPSISGRSLADTKWALVSYGDPAALKTVIAGTNPTLEFNSDTTRVSGTGGVNSFGGDCVRIDNQVSFTNLVQTLIASIDPAINDQENSYFQLLRKAQSVSFGSGTLTINCEGGQVLNFDST